MLGMEIDRGGCATFTRRDCDPRLLWIRRLFVMTCSENGTTDARTALGTMKSMKAMEDNRSDCKSG
jgi:hypothetical protein